LTENNLTDFLSDSKVIIIDQVTLFYNVCQLKLCVISLVEWRYRKVDHPSGKQLSVSSTYIN